MTSITKPPRPSRTLFRVGLPLLILVAGIATAVLIMGTRPEAKKRPGNTQPPLVQWKVAQYVDHTVTVSAMGTVLPATQIDLKARVSGQVERLSPNLIPGGRFKKGESLMSLDKADLRLALATAESRFNQAKADLDLELGNQDVARKELALMESTSGRPVKNQSLALRKPQLEKVEASLSLAQADVDKALLDLKRSEVRAPFDGIVLARSAPIGTLVSSGQAVATLTGDDAWWVEATLPVKDLPWIQIPGASGNDGSLAQILTQNGTAFQGSLLRLLGDMNDKSRMARILIEIKDPMGQATAMNTPPLLLNSYVAIKLKGKPLNGRIALPDRALRDDNEVWVADGSVLRIRKVQITWREESTVFVEQGLSPGDRIILSELSSPVDGMPIRTGDEAPKEKEATPPQR